MLESGHANHDANRHGGKRRQLLIGAIAMSAAIATVVAPGVGGQSVANAGVVNDDADVAEPSSTLPTVESTAPTAATTAAPAPVPTAATTTSTTSATGTTTSTAPSAARPADKQSAQRLPPSALEPTTTTSPPIIDQPCPNRPAAPTEILPQLDPIQINLDDTINKPTDNVAVLFGGMAETDGVLPTGTYVYKNRWYDCFDETSDYFIWNVSVSQDTEFVVRLNISTAPGDLLRLDVPGTSNTLTIQPSAYTTDFDMLEPGTITIPAGTHQLRLSKLRVATPPAGGTRSSSMKSVELIRASDYPAYQRRVERFRNNTDWLRGKKGYFVQWGAWSYPRVGARPDAQTVWNEFDVDVFADEMVRADVDYVIWSVTWVDYLFPGPIQAIDDITGPGYDRTADRDLLADVANALKDRGIDLMVYYHLGHGTEEGWFDFQNWPKNTFMFNGTGDRTVFFENWKRVITEVGNRYGSLIKGFFFDDGLTYYPANFEELGAVARSGYPERLISYNSFRQARYTDFQDVNFGEFNCSNYPVDWQGHYTAGPHKGLLAHCMTRMHNDWGSRSMNVNNPGFVENPSLYYQRYRAAADQGAHTLNHMMFNGPTFIDRQRNGAPGNDADNTRIGGQMPGIPVFDIEAGADGTLFGRSNVNWFSRYDAIRDRWTRNDTAESISMRSWRFGWGIRSRVTPCDTGTCPVYDLVRYQDNGTRGAWSVVMADVDLRTVTTGPDGSVFGVTVDNKIKRYTQGRLIELPGTWTDVAMGEGRNDLWALDTNGKPFHWDGTRWTTKPTHLTFTKIDAGNDGSVLAIINDGRLARIQNGIWVQYRPFGKVTDVSVISYDDFWVITKDNGWIGHNNNGTLEAARHTIA